MTTKASLAIHPGEHITDELDARGMTAAELARTMVVDPARVSRLVNGQTSVSGVVIDEQLSDRPPVRARNPVAGGLARGGRPTWL